MTNGWTEMEAAWKAHEGDREMLRAVWSDQLDERDRRIAMLERKISSHEIAEARRKCWHSDCNRTARLEWCGWRWCFRHYWTHCLRDTLRDPGTTWSRP